MDKAEVLRKATEFSKKAQNYLVFNKAVLFGSYIYGKPREDSDLDIAFFVDKLNEDADYLSLLITLNKLARQIDSRIEPHILYEEDENGFGDFVNKNGQEIILAN